MTTGCDHPDCRGTVAATGFCDTCGRRPAGRGAGRRLEPTVAGRPAGEDPAGAPVPTGGDPGGSAARWTDIPFYPVTDPADRLKADPVFPESSRFCARCTAPVGRSYRAQPGLVEGFCPDCGHWFSFRPTLVAGDVVAGRYAVDGCLAHGGLGWVYLGRDRNLDHRPVALKGLVNQGDDRALDLAVNERRSLTRLDHPGIVRIFDAVTHPGPAGAPVGYLVMAYVDGLTLREVVDGPARPLSGPLLTEHVARIGEEILSALAYLHGRNLLHCDMKPDNVILTAEPEGHGGSRVKLVDFGGVRRMGDSVTPLTTTAGYSPRDPAPYSARFDIYMVGMTLRDLATATADAATEDAATEGAATEGAATEGAATEGAATEGADHAGAEPVGLTSFRLLLDRATQGSAALRFDSATAMAEQLEGVRRELESLRTGRENPLRSGEFDDGSVLLDAGLGAAPDLEFWTGEHAGPARAAPMDLGLPSPAQVAVGLPAPLVDPGDRAAGPLARTSAPDARRLLDKLAASRRREPGSAAVEWLACRAHLELGDADAARECVARATAKLGRDADAHWRIPWFEGIVALAAGDVAAARAGFARVYGRLPGELAPKLALGCCAELAGEHDLADRYYEAVWRRDRSVAGAAFGLTRIALARGRRVAAVRILDEVPTVSRHYDAARLAAVRVCCGRLPAPPGEPRGLPGPADLAEAERRLGRLYLDGESRRRLTAALREMELVLLRAGAHPGAGPRSERTARTRLQESLRQVAWQARTAEEHGVLVDRANAVRPRTWW